MALPSISRWNGRLALVTGASYGIGSEICKLLVQHNINVVGCGRSKDRIEALAEECTKAGYKGKLYPFKCDLNQESDIEKMFNWIDEVLGGVDICINNAGFSSGEPILGCTVEKMREMLNTNVVALIACDNFAVKSMQKRGVDDGHIFHISSMLGHCVVNMSVTHSYGATKYAVTAITEGLRQELVEKKSKIRVTAISPALVDSNNFQMGAYGKEMSGQLQKLPQLAPKDVADAVVYALSAPETVQIHDILMRATGAN